MFILDKNIFIYNNHRIHKMKDTERERYRKREIQKERYTERERYR